MHGIVEVKPTQLETIYNQGLELPYVDIGQAEPAIKLVLDGEDYWYFRTLPLKGYGAVMAPYVRHLLEEEKKLLLARFWNRIYIYATGIRPIGAGKPPGG